MNIARISVHATGRKNHGCANLTIDLITNFDIDQAFSGGLNPGGKLHHLLRSDHFTQCVCHEGVGEQAAVFFVEGLQLLRSQIRILDPLCDPRRQLLCLFPFCLAIDHRYVIEQCRADPVA